MSNSVVKINLNAMPIKFLIKLYYFHYRRHPFPVGSQTGSRAYVHVKAEVPLYIVGKFHNDRISCLTENSLSNLKSRSIFELSLEFFEG